MSLGLARLVRPTALAFAVIIVLTAWSGELIALMGPSGSGKTTLLNILARRTAAKKAKVSGNALINGNSLSKAAFYSIASFVEQEDALIGSLTTRETIEIAAHLSRPRSGRCKTPVPNGKILTRNVIGLANRNDGLL